jgi:hypothetical protein
VLSSTCSKVFIDIIIVFIATPLNKLFRVTCEPHAKYLNKEDFAIREIINEIITFKGKWLFENCKETPKY